MREDLELEGYAFSLGFTSRYNIQGPPEKGYTLVFVGGNKTIWHCYKGWACAEIEDACYVNHRFYESLKEALDTECDRPVFKNDKYYKLKVTEDGFYTFGPFDTVDEIEVNSDSIVLLGSALKIKLQGMFKK